MYFNNFKIIRKQQVRMAERSKAPDSRFALSSDRGRVFWSSYEGTYTGVSVSELFGYRDPLFSDSLSKQILSELFDPRGLVIRTGSDTETPGGLDIQTQKSSDSLNEQILSELQGSRYPN